MNESINLVVLLVVRDEPPVSSEIPDLVGRVDVRVNPTEDKGREHDRRHVFVFYMA